MPRVLRAYYDLAVSPVTYNIVDFLFLAEMERLHIGADQLELYVVANLGDGFRADNLPLSTAGKEWRLRHIVLPAAALLPSCTGATYVPDRDRAAREFDSNIPVFPVGYTIEAPIADYTDSAVLRQLYLGRPLGSLRAPAQALKFVDEWLEERSSDKKIVSITLRQSRIQDFKRNSNLDAWKRFASELDPKRFFPVFIRDTGVLFGPQQPELDGCNTFDYASLDLELRLAFYERAYINMFLDTGAASLCGNDNLTRSIRLKIGTEYQPNVGPGYFQYRGYERGMQFVQNNNFQKTVWENDDYEVINREFYTMVEMIESGIPVKPNELPPLTETISRFIAGRNENDAGILCEALIASEPNSLEAQFLYGKYKNIQGEFNEAAGILEKVSMLSGEHPTVLYALSECLASAKRNMEAIEALTLANTKAPDDVNIACDLAYLISKSGDEGRAIEILEEVLATQPEATEALNTLGTIYLSDNRTLLNAYECFAKSMRIDPGQNHYRKLANCRARLSEYEEAAKLFHEAIVMDGKVSPEERTLNGFYLKYAGNERASESEFQLAIKDQENAIRTASERCTPIEGYLASKARNLVLLGRPEEANDTYHQITKTRPNSTFDFPEEYYYEDTPRRLNTLRERIAGRDVLILCHGPSVKQLADNTQEFGQLDGCFFSLNRFQVLQNSLLDPAGKHFDLVLVTHFHNFIPYMDHITAYLDRPDKPILAVNRATMNSLVLTQLTGNQIETQWNDQLLAIQGPGGFQPPVPDAPLRFLHGNTLTALIALAQVGHAKRIFVFGADGGLPEDKKSETHFDGGSSNDWRFEFQKTHRDILIDAMRADAVEFADTLEVNLIAMEALFGVPRIPIFNVSPKSNYDGMEKIDYPDAWRLLAE